MKNWKNGRFVIFCILLVAVMAAGCRGRETAASGGDASTETIAPAQPQPAPTGTDAMTQTVDVEGSRSEAEGGALTAGTSGSDPAATGTGATGTAASGTEATATTTR